MAREAAPHALILNERLTAVESRAQIFASYPSRSEIQISGQLLKQRSATAKAHPRNLYQPLKILYLAIDRSHRDDVVGISSFKYGVCEIAMQMLMSHEPLN
ncbi:MAG TPA: hypothetical protein DDY24_07715 [Alcaligenaceae bacterium]|nr:hypothetical protein [Alcaligenaceae bacterium]